MERASLDLEVLIMIFLHILLFGLVQLAITRPPHLMPCGSHVKLWAHLEISISARYVIYLAPADKQILFTDINMLVPIQASLSFLKKKTNPHFCNSNFIIVVL